MWCKCLLTSWSHCRSPAEMSRPPIDTWAPAWLAEKAGCHFRPIWSLYTGHWHKTIQQYAQENTHHFSIRFWNVQPKNVTFIFNNLARFLSTYLAIFVMLLPVLSLPTEHNDTDSQTLCEWIVLLILLKQHNPRYQRGFSSSNIKRRISCLVRLCVR